MEKEWVQAVEERPVCHGDCSTLCYSGKSLDVGSSEEFVLEYNLAFRRRILKMKR